MDDQTPHRMTVDEYLPWALARGGRWELIDGRPITMPSETFDHIDVKSFVWLTFKELVAESGLDLHVRGDGATVRIDEYNANEPDCLVYAGPKRPGKTLEMSDPVIVVEVVSPTSGKRDKGRKKQDYFSLACVEHNLVVDPDQRTVLHFDRSNFDGHGRLLGEGAIVDAVGVVRVPDIIICEGCSPIDRHCAECDAGV